MGWFLYVVWVLLIAFIVYASRMAGFYKRETMYWQARMELAKRMLELSTEHPEYDEAYERLAMSLKADADLHLLERDTLSTWDRFKDGGKFKT